VKAILAVLALLLLAPAAFAPPARAVEPSERLSDPALEARARALSEELRCLVCQNETIDESSAPLAHDLRVLLRERIADGDTDAQAVKYLTDRYGDFVLLKPPVVPATYLLWFGPIIVLLLAGSGASIYVRKRKSMAPVAPLSAAEEQRIERLLKEES
jgi:cytochrome c-type biogenesis protein CcmH